MKIQYLYLNAIIILIGTTVFAGEVQYDDHYFITMNAALVVPHSENKSEAGFGLLKTNAESLYLLERIAFKTVGISNLVKLNVVLSALEANTRYAATVNSPEKLMTFITSSNLSMALALLTESSNTLARIPVQIAAMNVGAPGVPVAGMDPVGIKDLKIRQEYERRITENEQIIIEMNLRHRVETKIDYFKRAISSLIQYAHLQNKGELLLKEVGPSLDAKAAGS
jgi:hypothetical protein